MLLYIIAAEVLENFTILDKRIKGIQIGNQEIKIVNFDDDHNFDNHLFKRHELPKQSTINSKIIERCLLLND